MGARQADALGGRSCDDVRHWLGCAAGCMPCAWNSILLAGALTLVIGLVLLPLARSWARSSHAGGYRLAHGPDGVEHGPKVPEDDDITWHWPDAQPGPEVARHPPK